MYSMLQMTIRLIIKQSCSVGSIIILLFETFPLGPSFQVFVPFNLKSFLNFCSLYQVAQDKLKSKTSDKDKTQPANSPFTTRR